MSSVDDALRVALEQREVRVDRRLSLFRAVFVVLLGAFDGSLALAAGSTTWGLGIFAGCAVWSAGSLGVYFTLRDGRYRPALKYVSTTLDVGSTAALYILYRDAPFIGGLGLESFALSVISALPVVNLLSALRRGFVIVAFSTALSLAAAIGILAAAAVSPVFIAVTALLVFWSGILAAVISHQNGQLFVSLRRRDQLTRFLPREIVDRVDRGELSLDLGGRSSTVTVLMSDIRGFTTLSESRDPLEVVELLNEYFTEMARVIAAHGGAIDKYIGDAILAVWGIPEAREDDAERAVRAALDMQKALADLNARREERGALPFQIGVGVHTGVVVAGGIGSPERMDYTVIGDAVNVGARIEGLTKEYKTPVLISEATWERVKAHMPGEEVAEASLRGRSQRMRLYKVSGA